MAITISIDNDRVTAGIQTLTLDESPGVQTPASADDGNDINVFLTAGAIDGLLAPFETFLNGTMFSAFTLTADQKSYAANVDGASSSTDFVKVTVTQGETIDDLFFSDASGAPLNGDQVVGMQTLDGQNIYLWSNGDFCIATTSATAGAGRIVAAFYLSEDPTTHLTAQLQMVTFEPIKDPDTTDPDDTLDFTNILNVSASGSITFDFDQLKSGSSLWVAVGNSAGGLLVTGGNPDVDGSNKKTNTSDVIHTSQGGQGATIGVNNQLFDNVGETATFTLVTGLASLGTAPDAGATGDYTVDPLPNKKPIEGIDYSGYINTTGAGIFLSQSQGNDPKNLDIVLWEAGGDAGGAQTAEDLTNYIGGLPPSDTAVNVASVTITDNDGVVVGVWGAGGTLNSGDSVNNHNSSNGTANITVTFSGNTIDVDGVLGEYTVSWTSAAGETFNRFEVIAQGGQFDVGRVDVDNVVGDTEAVGDKLIIDDDGPAISPLIANGSVTYAAGQSDSDTLNGSVGTDILGTFEITSVSPSTTTLLGVTLTARIDPGDNTLVNIYQEKNATDGFQSGASGDLLYYTLSLEDLLAAGNGSITAGLDSWVFTVVNAPVAPPLEFNFAGLPSGQNLFGMVASAGAPNGPGVLFFGEDSQIKANGEYTNTSDTINTSQGGGPTTIGNSNQMIDAGEGIYFTVINDPADAFLANVTGGLDQNEADDADNMDFASLREVSSSFVRISQTQGNEVEAASIEAFNITKPPAGPTQDRDILTASGQNHVDIVKVNVWSDVVGGNLLETTNATGGDGGLTGALTVTIDGDGIAHVAGLEAGYVVEWITDDPATLAVERHDQALITGEVGKFDIGGFGISEPQQVPDHFYDFTVKLTDADGDFVTDTFRVVIDNPLV